MKTHKFLALFNFLNSFAKENRIVFRANPQEAPEVANPNSKEQEERIQRESQARTREVGGERAEAATSQNPLENVIDQLSKEVDGTAKQAIFDKLLDSSIVIMKSSPEARGIVTPINLSDFSETQFATLLRIASGTLSTTKEQNLTKILAKISPQGPFNAVQLGKESIGLLLTYTDDKPAEKQKIMDVIATSPTRLSDLIDLYKGDTAKLKDLLKLIPDYLNLIKGWLTDGTLSNRFSTDALAVLINNDIFPIKEFVKEDFIQKIPFRTLIDLAGKLTNDRIRKPRLMNYIRKNIGKVIKEDPSLIDKLLEDSSVKTEVLNNLRGYLLENEKKIQSISDDCISKLINEFFGKDERFIKLLAKKMNDSTRAHFIDNMGGFAGLSEPNQEKLLMELNPLVKTAIDKFGLKKIDREYRRLNHPGTYFFEGANPKKIYYKNTTGIQSCLIEAQGEEVWDRESWAPTTDRVKATIGNHRTVKTNSSAKLYENLADTTGTAGGNLKLEVIDPVQTEFRVTDQDQIVPFVKAKTIDEPIREVFVKLTDLNPIKELEPNFGKDFVTTEDTEFKTAVSIVIPKGEKLSVVEGSKVRIIEGREFVYAKWLKKGVMGYIEKSFIAKPDKAPKLEGDKAREIYEDFCINCNMVEETKRSLATGAYHPSANGAKAYVSPSGQMILKNDVKFTVPDGKIYKITKLIPNPSDPDNPNIQESLVVRYENAKQADETDFSPGFGYIEIDELIAGEDITQDTAGDIKYEASEWTSEQVHSPGKKVPTNKSIETTSSTYIVGTSADHPEKQEIIDSGQQLTTIEENVRIVKDTEYIKVKTTLGDHDITGWVPLSDVNIKQAEILVADTAEKIEQTVTRKKMDKVLIPDAADPNTFTVNFNYPQDHAKAGKLNKSLQTATKINDIFPTSESKDIVEITPNGQTQKITAEFRNGLYYIKKNDVVTKKRAIIMDGDKIKFIPKRNTAIDVTKEEEGSPNIKTINFKDTTGRINKTLERTVKLTDIFINIKEGDKVVITPKGKGSKSDIAEYKKDGSSGETFYYTMNDASHRKIGSRAVIFHGDKVQLVRKAEAAKEIGRHYGTFPLPKETLSQTALMEKIYKKHPSLEAEIAAAGLTEHEYYKQIHATEDSRGSYIYILKPRKSLSTAIEERRAEKQRRQDEVSKEDTKEHQRIVTEFDHYYTDKFKVKKSLLQYVNDDELWNDLWAHRGKESDKYIDGLEEVVTIMRENFQLSEFKTRDTLKKIIQIGYNKHVDFEDIFESLAKPLYLQLRKKYGDKLGFSDKINTYKDFKKDLEKTSKIVRKWQDDGESKKEDYDKILLFKKEETKISILEEQAVARGTLSDFKRTTKYKEYVARRTELAPSLRAYNKEYLPASKKLEILVKRFLVPTARLLDAISDMDLGVSKELTGFQEYNNDIAKAQEIAAAEIPEGTPPYYDLSVLTTPTKEGLTALSENEMSHITEDDKEKYAVTISKEHTSEPKDPITTFKEVGKALGLTNPEINSFGKDDILKLIFQLYSVQTLIQEGCLKTVKGKENVLLLSKLPDNFKSTTPAVKELFEGLKTSEEIDSKQDLITKTAEILDNNKKILRKIAQLYGSDSPTVRIVGAFSSKDTVELDMSEIGAGAVTLPKGFFTDRMSGESAQKDIIGRITSIKDGVTTLDERNLIQVLSKDLRAGLSSLPVLSRNIPELNDLKISLEDTYGSRFEGLSSISDAKLYKYFLPKLKEFIANPEGSLSGIDGENIMKLIKIGRIFNVITNKTETPDHILQLPEDPTISKMIKSMIDQRKEDREVPLTQEDVNKIEQACLFGIGAMVGTSGKTGGVGLAIPFDLGDGWTISAGAGIGMSQGSLAGGAGVSVSKTFKLSKDGKTQLTVGVHGGYAYAGGSIGIKYAIGDKTSMGITGVGGWIPGGFYAGGVISFNHEPEWERQTLEGKEMIRIGYDLIDKLIADGESENTIANAILLAPDVGKELRRLKAEYQLPNKAIVDLYKTQRRQTSKEITDKIAADAPIVSGGGLGMVWVQAGPVGIPVPNMYLQFNVGSEICVFRTTTQGTESLDQESQREADAQILRQLKGQYGDKAITMMETKVPNEGQFIYDSISGQPAFLKGRQSIDLGKYDQFNQLNDKLNGIGINLVPDKKTKLTRIEVPKAQGNVKLLIDPEIEEQLIVKNGEVYITMDAEHTDLIFQKENFSYPYQHNGATTLSVITIKRNPTRTRDEIENESPSIIYQRPRYQAEVRKGLRTKALEVDTADSTYTPAITTYQEFQTQTTAPRLRDAEKAAQMNSQYTTFLAEAVIVKEREAARAEFNEKTFGDAFLANSKHQKAYRQLSTRLVGDFHNVEKTQENTDKLHALIREFGKTYKFAPDQTLEPIRNLEMQQILTYLMTESFIKLPKKNKEKVFRKNLESFGQKYLEQFFGESARKIKESNPSVEITTSPALMAQYVISDLKDVDINGPAAKGLEKMGLLSLVGTGGIKGLRGTPLYESDMVSKMLELTDYKPGSANTIESDIGKVIIELASPLDKTSEKTFMESPLSVKMLAHPGMFLILGAEDAMKVATCFKTKEVSVDNKAAFEKFKRIVLTIRAAQYSGRNIIDAKTPGLNPNDFPKDYSISVDPTTSIGVYQQCGNPTIAFDEGIAIFIPKTKGLAGETQVYSRVDADSRVKFKTFKLGISVAIEPGPDQAPEEPPTEEDPKDLDKGVETGADNNPNPEPVVVTPTEGGTVEIVDNPGSGGSAF